MALDLSVDSARAGRRREASTASSASSTSSSDSPSAGSITWSSSSSSSLTATTVLGEDDRACGYCANLSLLRDILPPKRCDYVCAACPLDLPLRRELTIPSLQCHLLKCQFCTLKFPLLNVKKVLPKSMKGNSRICIQCFGEIWQRNGVSSSRGPRRASVGAPPLSRRLSDQQQQDAAADARWSRSESFDAATLGPARPSLSLPERPDDAHRDQQKHCGKGPIGQLCTAVGIADPTKAGCYHSVAAVNVWMSLLVASVLVVAAVMESVSSQERLVGCVVLYAVFLAIHPSLHLFRSRGHAAATPDASSVLPAPDTHGETPCTKDRAASQPRPLPQEYEAPLQRIRDLQARYLSKDCAWRVVKACHGGKIYETTTEHPQPLFMAEVFVPGISIDRFLTFLCSTNLKKRAVWDWNVARNDVVETFAGPGGVSVVYNAQKAFLGGFVSSRDFCLLYSRTETTLSYLSVEHPDVPERPPATRGHVHFACFDCTPQRSDSGDDGFVVRYLCQADIGGSIPTRLLYNGNLDNMEKVMKAFKQAKKLFL
ncbi:hypothetical protein ATCC90586_006992 [Pythium insidiosum]|nr:hypothetical protein ATCC90586_006992 [Pythium insidiosum]